MIWDGFTGDFIYLDSNILIFAVEQGNPWTALLGTLFVAIDERRIHAVTSELTMAEVLAKPLELEAADVIGKYEQLLSPESVITVAPIDRAVLRAAAQLRGQLQIKLLDAIHVATAIQNHCDFFLTNDNRLGTSLGSHIRWLSLPELMERP